MKKPRNMRATAAAIALQRANGTVEKDVLARRSICGNEDIQRALGRSAASSAD
ncbi:hypothetical protein [Mycetohabitans sp. B46]|uniref:hypothetical protein n=1 Tax=Mycetohabitans sp. B46 TaxID=2772536 RepID=UPI00307E9DFF